MDPKVELREVQKELAEIEDQIQELLNNQSFLLARQKQLKAQIRDEAEASASTSSAAAASASASATKNDDLAKTDFPWSNKLDELKKSIFKINTFRPLQLQTMNCTLSGKDCILIMPTGGGKSLCFQLPALVSKGITLVVSPLVSLMEDQLMGLQELNVAATLLDAASTKGHIKTVQDDMTNPNAGLKLLYVTPEKLAKSKRFMNRLEKMFQARLFARLVIDEVHCCSQWGHDFRPDYKFLGVMRRQFPGVPILGLTATATHNVLTDVQKILSIKDAVILRASFNRHNLYYEVRAKPSTTKETMEDIHKQIKNRFQGKCGIVYCLTQKDSEDVTRELQLRGIKAGCYHANLDKRQRSHVHAQWAKNHIQVVVATIAFGMGIDKSDVRFVIHHSMSKSMENYYQESGRAGRDDDLAHCILYASFSDLFRLSTMVFTEQTGLDNLYGMVKYAYDLNRCRRSLTAEHFGERWDSSQCNEMCDICDPSNQGRVVNKDVMCYAKDLVAILENAQASQQRVTGLKLLDAWLGKGASSLRLNSVIAPRLSRNDCIRTIVMLLLKGYLKEEFHFTPYSTISYLLPGIKAKRLSVPGHTVEVAFVAENKPKPAKTATSLIKTASVKSTASSSTSSSQPGLKKARTVHPVVVNTENSKFMPDRFAVAGSSSQKEHSYESYDSTDANAGPSTKTQDPNLEVKLSNTSKGKVARKRPVLESDSDTDTDFDFGESKNVQVVAKKKKVPTATLR